MKRLFYRFFKRYRRLELGLFTDREADTLIKVSVGKPERAQWVIAKEQCRHRNVGWVYLERRERITS
jgi:hypothetical protein